MAAGAAPAEAPAFSLTIGLWALCAVLVGIGLKAGWEHSIGYAFRWLGSHLKVGVFGHGVNFGGPFNAVNNAVEDALGKWVLGSEKALGLWWQANKQVLHWTADSITGFGNDVHDAIHGLVYGTIPATVNDAVKPTRDRVGHVDRTTRARAADEARARSRGIDATQRDIAAERLARERGIDYITKEVLPRVFARERALEADVAGLEHSVGRLIPARLTRLERWLGAGVIGGAAIAALTRVFPYWQCSNVKRFNKLLCRSPFGALEDLLGLAALLLGPLSIVELAHLLQGVVDEVDDGVRFFVTETRG